MNASCFWYYDKHKKTSKPSGYWLWRLLPYLLIVAGIYLLILCLQAGKQELIPVPYFITLFAVFLILIQVVMYPANAKRYMVVIDAEMKPWIVDISSLHFLKIYGLEAYKPAHPSGRTAGALYAIAKNKYNFQKVNEYIDTHNVIDILTKYPTQGGLKIAEVTHVRKEVFCFLVKYKAVGVEGKLRARFYNDISDYERLYELFMQGYMSKDRQIEKDRKVRGIVFMVLAAFSMIMTVAFIPQFGIIYLNVGMLIFSCFLFAIGLRNLIDR